MITDGDQWFMINDCWWLIKGIDDWGTMINDQWFMISGQRIVIYDWWRMIQIND